MKRTVVVIAHDLRSTHNIGSLLRTAEGLGIDHVYLSGYTPYPLKSGDTRLPHLAHKIHKAIQKTALGAENSQAWTHTEDINRLIQELKQNDFTIVALEQTPLAISLPNWSPSYRTALILGREVEGIDASILEHVDLATEIPMSGKKESFNVVQAAAMALYHIRFTK